MFDGRFSASSRSRKAQRLQSAVQRRIIAATSTERSAATLAASASALILDGRAERALELLLEALTLSPSDACLWSDLAALYIGRSTVRGDPVDLVQALQAADRAVELSSNLGEARYNRALALQRLHVVGEARAAWQFYANRDQRSGWGAAAQRFADATAPRPTTWRRDVTALLQAVHLGDNAIVRSIVSRNPQQAREFALDDQLALWAQLKLAGQSAKAAFPLAVARAIGRVLAAQGTDDFTIADVVQAIDLAGSRQDDMALSQLAYTQGRYLYRTFDIEKALPLLLQCERTGSITGSPIVLWARLWEGGISLYQYDFGVAAEVFHEILRAPSIRRYPSLAALASWLLGVEEERSGRFPEALAHFQAASQLLERTHEEENLGSSYSLIAEALEYLGQSRQAWRYRERAAALLIHYPSSIHLQNLWREAASAALSSGTPHAALDFQSECIRVADESQSPLAIADALIVKSRIEAIRTPQGAHYDLAVAAQQAHAIAGATLRNRLLRDLDAAAGELATPSDPRQGVALLTTALDYYRDKGLDLNLAPALLARAQAWLAASDAKRAEEDLATGIRVFERHRTEVKDLQQRLSFLRTGSELFDQMIEFQAEKRHNPEAAFQYSERARAALDGATSGRSLSLAPAKVSAPLSSFFAARTSLSRSNTVLVEYALTTHRLLIWLISATDTRWFILPVRQEQLAAATRRLLTALRDRSPLPQIISLAGSLYDTLIAPLAQYLPNNAALVIVPDKFLNALPFAALVDRRTGRFLVEEHAVSLTPQAWLYLGKPISQRNMRSMNSSRLLLVANPLFDRRRFPWLPQLPGAEQEAAEISMLYPHVTSLAREQATRAAVLSRLAQADILHFAGHALASAADPEDIELLLAQGSSDDSGILRPPDLLGLPLFPLNLAVLSGCRTSIPDDSRTGGLFGLARPFLQRGTASVVGTLWDVDDNTTGALLADFHRAYLTMGDTSSALRFAQIAQLRSTNLRSSSPSSWAAYCLIQSRRTL